MKTWNRVSVRSSLILLSIAIFSLDFLFPRGVASGVPYAAVVLLSLWTGKSNLVLITASAVSVLTVVGFFHPLPEGPIIGLLANPSIWISIENRLIALFAIWTTAILGVLLIRRDEAIRRERDFNECLIETASSIILVLGVDGRILHYNRFARDLIGRELSDTKYKNWLTLFVPETEHLRAQKLFEECLAGSAGQEKIIPVLAREGEQRQFSWGSRRLENEQCEPIGVVCVGQDITPLLDAQEKVVQSERLAAIGQAIAALSHEARNELLALKLNLSALDRRALDDDSHHLVENLCEVENRISRLFDDLRSFAAPICLHRQSISVADLWRKAWTSLDPKHCGKAELLEQNDDVCLSCSVDPQRIEQVFRNLLENALAAGESSVRISINCSEVAAEGKTFLRIQLRDNGPGLSPEARKKIFEPFFTTKTEGTGLGMPICKRIIEAHGGDLRAGNHAGGAEFIILLPKN